MEEIRSYAALAFYFIILLCTIRIWTRIAEVIGNALGIRKLANLILRTLTRESR